MSECKKKGREFYENDPVMLARYDIATKHAEHARAAGWTSEQIHDLWRRIMAGETDHNCLGCKDK